MFLKKNYLAALKFFWGSKKIQKKGTNLNWFERLRGKGARGDLLDEALQFSVARMDDPGGGERDADGGRRQHQQRQHPAAPHFLLLACRGPIIGAEWVVGADNSSRHPAASATGKRISLTHSPSQPKVHCLGGRAQEAAIRLSGLRRPFFFACGARAACGGTKLCPFALQLPPAAAAHKTRNLCAAFCFPRHTHIHSCARASRHGLRSKFDSKYIFA